MSKDLGRCNNCGKPILIKKIFPQESRKYQAWIEYIKIGKEEIYCWRCWKIAIEIFKETMQEAPKLDDSQFV